LILEAALDDGLDGPLQALPWMRQEAERRQMVLADGMLLMTGCCGSAIPARAGRYRADYGPLGTLELTITD